MSAQPRFIQLVETMDAYRARRPRLILALPPALPPVPPAPFAVAADYERPDDFDPMAAYALLMEQRVGYRARAIAAKHARQRSTAENAYMAAAVRRGNAEFAAAERTMYDAPPTFEDVQEYDAPDAWRNWRPDMGEAARDWQDAIDEQRYGGWSPF